MSHAEFVGEAVQPEKKPLLVEFDLGEFGGLVSIPASEARQWRDREIGAWDWVRTLSPNEYGPLVNIFQSATKNIRRNVDPNLVSLESTPSEATARAVGESMVRAFKSVRLYTQATPHARLVQEVATSDKPMAAGALAYFMRAPVSNLSGAILAGTLKAFAFEQGFDERVEKEAEALSALRAEWQEGLTKLQLQASEQLGRIEASLAQRNAEAVSSSATAKKQLEEQAAAHGKQHEDATKSLTTLEATYNANLALKAPVTYWSAKRKYHAERAKKTARWIAWYFVAGIIALFLVAAHLLDIESGSALRLPIWHLAVFASVLALFIWGARILVRLMLSNQHLESDAHERIVIANTYLALVRGGKLPETATSQVLEALLRHSPDGIVRDDALPLVTEMLKKAD